MTPSFSRRGLVVASVGSAAVALAAPRACGWFEGGDPPLLQRAGLESAYGGAACRADALDLGPPAAPGTPGLKVLVEPRASARDAARVLSQALPRSRVYFSQTTGRPMLVHGDGLPLVTGRPPVSEGDLEAPRATLVTFLEAFPDLFQLSDPSTELAAKDPYGDPPLAMSTRWRLDLESGGFAARFDQVHLGLPVADDHVIGFFSADGDLLALVARLEPSVSVAAEFASLAESVVRIEDLGAARWDRVDGRPVVVEREVVGRTGPPGPIVRTTWELDIATGARRELRRFVEVRSAVPLGAPLDHAADEAEPDPPVQDWVQRGRVVEAHAPDSRGEVRTVLSTRTPDGLFLGWHSTDYLDPGRWVSVADAEGRLLGLLGLVFVVGDPIGTRAPDWTEDPGYAGRYTAATELAVHLRGALAWFYGHHELRSWDDAGASVSGAINGDPWLSPDGFYNAYAGPGFLVIGDGRDPTTGRTLAAAQDVVGHELTHAVLLVHTAWNYEGEAGAVSESVADLLGNAIEGVEASYEVGEAAGAPVRDLADPGRFGLPATYDQLRLVSEDHGGVHANSAILGRAAVSIWDDHGRDPMPLAELVVDALQGVPWDADVRIEEFGSALLATCWVQGLGSDQPGYHGALCESVKRGLCRTRVLVDPTP